VRPAREKKMKELETMTILVKTYPGTGRPSSFEVVNDDDLERIEYLEEAWGYSVVDTGLPADIDPWEEYTTTDPDGFVQWK